MMERSAFPHLPDEGKTHPAEGPSPRLVVPGSPENEGGHETYYDDQSVFFWMERDAEGREPLSWLGNHFPQGCRFCM